MTRPWRLPALGALMAAATVAFATPTVRLATLPRDSACYPAQVINVGMDHAIHMEMGMGCQDCHTLAAESRSAADHLVPNEEACSECHEGVRPSSEGSHPAEEGCRACHPGEGEVIEPSVFPPSFLRFSHAAHVSDMECARCHTRVEVRTVATVDDLPDMVMCLACHDGSRADRRCATCHPADPDGVLQTSRDGGPSLLPPAWMSGAEHGPDWTNEHGAVGTAHRRLCFACHRQHECLACHDGSIRPREVHPGDWMRIHASESRAGEQRCEGCHRGQSFCRTCHVRAGVAQGSPSGRSRGPGPVVHREADWAMGSPPSHGVEARRSLTSCVSCHAGQECAACHSAINPHGPGFASRCRSLLAAGSRACGECHGDTTGLCE